MRKITPKKPGEYGPEKTLGGIKPIYPGFCLGLEHIPEAKKWKLGEEYTVELKVKLTGLSQSRFQNNADFEITEIGVEGGKEDKD